MALIQILIGYACLVSSPNSSFPQPAKGKGNSGSLKKTLNFGELLSLREWGWHLLCTGSSPVIQQNGTLWYHLSMPTQPKNTLCILPKYLGVKWTTRKHIIRLSITATSQISPKIQMPGAEIYCWKMLRFSSLGHFLCLSQPPAPT